ncbi:Proline--tRNA ligase [Candidatus Anstonella stagnisolia]|nr:Proline--tRNA ligase [Candidatus Anstonella stagnisolia]
MRVKKDANFSEWYTELIKEAELADIRYNVKGFVVFQPWSVMSMMKMYRMYEAELEGTGHLPAWFPALIPEGNFLKEGEHVKGFAPDVFWVTEAGGNPLEEKLAMRPTSETSMYQMYSLWIQGKKDLPLKIYHSSQVWRHETKATRPFIRSREFYWIEAHDAFATYEESVAQVKEDMEMAQNVIHGKFGVPFVFFCRPQWDKFPGALNTYAADCMMPDGKVLQLPSTHLLGQNFAKAFDVKYQDESGTYVHCWQTCYGPAISRIYAAIISTHGDDKGLVLPFELAPVQVVVVPIPKKGEKNENLDKKADEIGKKLKEHGLRVAVDKSDNTPGFKYNHWELKGACVRVEVGMRELESNEFVVANRVTGEKLTVKADKLAGEIEKMGTHMISLLKKKADEKFAATLASAERMSELEKALKAGKLVKVAFCTMEMQGKACADEVKSKTAGDVRGTRYDAHEKPKEKRCIVCGKPAAEYVYVARQY